MRGRPRSTHCKRGHAMTGTNVRVGKRRTKSGRIVYERGCRTCRKLRAKWTAAELNRAWAAAA